MSLYKKHTLSSMQQRRDYITEQFLITKDQNKRKALSIEMDLINSIINSLNNNSL